MPRVSIDAQYARRWYGNFVAQDDLAVGPADYTKFTIPAPSDSRLPNGGGYALTAFDLTPTANATAQNILARAPRTTGTGPSVFDGVSVVVRARLQNGFLLQAGIGTGRVVTDDCEIVDKLPETLHQFLGNDTRTFVFAARPSELCHANNGFRTSANGLASYTIPKIDLLLSGTFQNLPGGVVSANANTFSNTTTLGRPFSGAPFRVFNIVQPGDLYIERLNQLDFRVSKIFKAGTSRTSLNFDFYNMLNSGSVLAENFTYGTAWRTPQSILLARLFKLSAQLDF